MTDPVDAVHEANSAFYAALESCDLDAMADLWEHSDRVSVTHPGWPMLRGWAKVAGSWDAIFRNTGYIQFVLTDEQVVVVGDTAWVTLDENILQSAGNDELSGSTRDRGQPVRAGSRRRRLGDGRAPQLAGCGRRLGAQGSFDAIQASSAGPLSKLEISA